MSNQIQLRELASCSYYWLRLEQLLRIFRALQTSRVLYISMNACWRMNQLINCICFSLQASGKFFPLPNLLKRSFQIYKSDSLFSIHVVAYQSQRTTASLQLMHLRNKPSKHILSGADGVEVEGNQKIQTIYFTVTKDLTWNFKGWFFMKAHPYLLFHVRSLLRGRTTQGLRLTSRPRLQQPSLDRRWKLQAIPYKSSQQAPHQNQSRLKHKSLHHLWIPNSWWWRNFLRM